MAAYGCFHTKHTDSVWEKAANFKGKDGPSVAVKWQICQIVDCSGSMWQLWLIPQANTQLLTVGMWAWMCDDGRKCVPYWIKLYYLVKSGNQKDLNSLLSRAEGLYYEWDSISKWIFHMAIVSKVTTTYNMTWPSLICSVSNIYNEFLCFDWLLEKHLLFNSIPIVVLQQVFWWKQGKVCKALLCTKSNLGVLHKFILQKWVQAICSTNPLKVIIKIRIRIDLNSSDMEKCQRCLIRERPVHEKPVSTGTD